MTDWTKSEEATLREMWLQGQTARDIGAKLNRTRMSVIGKAGRMDLPPHQRKVVHTPDTVPKVPSSESVRVRSCQWPHGHPTDTDFHFCGLPAILGKPYCLEHCQRAFRKEQTDETR